MRVFSSLSAASLLLTPFTYAATGLARRDYSLHDVYAVELEAGVQPEDFSEHLGLHYDGPLGELENHYLFRTDSRQDGHDRISTAIADLKHRRRKRELGANVPHILDHVLLSQKQELHKRFPLVKRNAYAAALPQDQALSPLAQEHHDIADALDINDPIFFDQWHLFNTVQRGHDLNVSGVWEDGITGVGSTVCIVDDGLDMDSEDLKDNYFAEGSYDFNNQSPDPRPRLSDDRHGTRCAGEIAAVRNDVCGIGVAYDGKVSACRILSRVISNADEAIAMNYAYQDNDIYSCSWGPPDDGKSMEAPDVLIQRAMITGVQKGRAGLGSIYVFAIGNGAANDDNCNFDGYTNSIYSVSVGGIDRKGLHPYYSEKCSAQLVVTYSSGSGDAIHTTDVGEHTCYVNHGGTSAAGPLVAGIYSLALQANRNLTWRDIQYITVLTAVKIDQPSDWRMNKAIGKEFSHQFGYGKADAWALVEMAKTWTNVKPQAWYFGPWLHVKHEIPQGTRGLASSFTVTEDMMKEANLERLEHVTVTMNVEHTRRGDLSVELRSPSGMVSHIATHRRNDAMRAGYVDWTFMSVAHWGESGVGEWRVIVKDTNVNDHTGVFTDWRLKFYGEAIDGDKQELLPLPGRHDDDDHDIVPTQTASVGTTSVAVPTSTATVPPGNPDDHQHRPVISKVSSTTSSTTRPARPTTLPVDEDADETQPTSTATSTSTSNSNFLPRPFPTFGVSKGTQVWIYGALALILTFLGVLGGWTFWVKRQKKRRWDQYAFEMVDRDDDDDNGPGVRGANGHANGGVNGEGRKKRAGELYDAFAEGSDGDDMFELGSEDDSEAEEDDKAKRYRDVDPYREGSDVR